eukprot:3768883-Pyramimonas_sp.AAC.3
MSFAGAPVGSAAITRSRCPCVLPDVKGSTWPRDLLVRKAVPTRGRACRFVPGDGGARPVLLRGAGVRPRPVCGGGGGGGRTPAQHDLPLRHRVRGHQRAPPQSGAAVEGVAGERAAHPRQRLPVCELEERMRRELVGHRHLPSEGHVVARSQHWPLKKDKETCSTVAFDDQR